MNSSLFALLMNLFEKRLSQLQANQTETADSFLFLDKTDEIEPFAADIIGAHESHKVPLRVFTYEEQIRLTKASYQFLMRMRLWQVITPSLFELVMVHLQLSSTPIVKLEETKWIARKVLATVLDEKQLAFLDLVLYPKEKAITRH
jgi:uncharacterized protein Smg (DUF494 family)